MTPIKLILFLEQFFELYDTRTKIASTCKNKRCKNHGKQTLIKCKCKKNNLHKQFVNNNIKMNEIKSKKYESNLVIIFQKCKRTYNKLHEENKK